MGKPVKMIRAKAKSPETAAAPADRAERRAKRAEKVTRATTVTFTLEPPVRRFMDAQAKAAGMNLTHYMQKLVEDHLIDAAPKTDPLALRLAAKRHVIARAVTLATEMDAAGRFDDHFILHVVQEAAKDAEFAAQYAVALGGPEAVGTRAAERAKVSLNQQIGRLVKKAVGARSKRNEKGKIARAQVQNEMISTYTLLEKAA